MQIYIHMSWHYEITYVYIYHVMHVCLYGACACACACMCVDTHGTCMPIVRLSEGAVHAFLGDFGCVATSTKTFSRPQPGSCSNLDADDQIPQGGH